MTTSNLKTVSQDKPVVLVVGQTPPPFHGQAVMIDLMLRSSFPSVSLKHVRMAFSRSASEIGTFQLRKVFHLMFLVWQILRARFKYGAEILYYPPAGPAMLPVWRDICILISTRPFFKKTIFHFHAGGASEMIAKTGAVTRFLYHLAFDHPDCCILLSSNSPADNLSTHAARAFVIPNGLEDVQPSFPRPESETSSPPLIMLSGILSEHKGVMVLLRACRLLLTRGLPFRLVLMGPFNDPAFEENVLTFIRHNGLESFTLLTGLRTGNDKWATYRDADIFCFPTHYEAEGHPLVVLEAMQFALPVVATAWRGIPTIVEDEVTGYLVPVKDETKLAEKLELLMKNTALRHTMGQKGRKRFLSHFRIDRWISRMNDVFSAAANE